MKITLIEILDNLKVEMINKNEIIGSRQEFNKMMIYINALYNVIENNNMEDIYIIEEKESKKFIDDLLKSIKVLNDYFKEE